MRRLAEGLWQWLARKVRKWLEVPTQKHVSWLEARQDAYASEFDAHRQQVQEMLDRRQATFDRLEKQLEVRRKEASKLMAEAERVASQTTIAASDVITAFQLFQQGYDPGLARGGSDESAGTGA